MSNKRRKIRDFDLDSLNDDKPIARAAIRVSLVRGKEPDKTFGPDLQLEEAALYCRLKKLDLDEAGSIACQDTDVSGFRLPWRKRPGMAQHLEAARRGEFKHLVFYKLSRLARNLKEGLDLVDTFEKLGVTLHFIKDSLDSSVSSGRFIRNVLLAAAEMQSEDISDFISDAIVSRAKKGGQHHGATPAWIERLKPSETATSEIEERFALIPVQADNMRRIVELRKQGLGYVLIARRMNAEGRRTGTLKQWTEGTVYKYLSPTWIDTMEGVGFVGRDLPEGHSHRVRIPNLFPPILHPEEAEALRIVQRKYREHPTPTPVAGGKGGNWEQNKARREQSIREGDRRYSASSSYLLAGRVFCATCGERLNSGQASSNEVNCHKYFCTRARTRSEDHSRAGVSVNAASLEDGVLRVLRMVLAEPPAPVKRRAPVVMSHEKALGRIQEQIDRVTARWSKKLMADADYDRSYANLTRERDELLQRDREVTAPVVHAAAHALATEQSSQECITREQLRQLVMLAVERVQAPIVFEGIHVRGAGTGLRRFARVTLAFETRDGHRDFIVPLYTDRYQGEKELPQAI